MSIPKRNDIVTQFSVKEENLSLVEVHGVGRQIFRCPTSFDAL